MSRKNSLIISVLSFLGVAFLAHFSLAQGYGVNEVNAGLQGSLAAGEDIRVVAARFIQLALGFLGVIAVLLIMYAGFLWMTSGGNEEKIDKAKKILKNGVIGLIIILSAWAITTFILRKISDTLSGNDTYEYQSQSSNLSVSGIGAVGACSVESIYPEDGQGDVPRNTSLMITFKEELSLDSVCVNDTGDSCACDNSSCNLINPQNIRIFKTDLGDACSSGTCPSVNTNLSNVLVSVVNDKKTLILVPGEYLGSADGNTPYSLLVTSGINKASGASMFANCSTSYLQSIFTVSNTLDLVPPIVVPGKIFPLPDNEKDLFNQTIPAKAATSEIEIAACPQKYSAARLISVSPNDVSVVLDYSGNISLFKVSVPAESQNKAQLFNGQNNALLGIADFDESGKVVFDNYLSLQAESHPAGSSWDIVIKPEVLADTIQINSDVYTFSDSSVNNNIEVVSNCNSDSSSDLNTQAVNIHAVLSGHPDIRTELQGNKVLLTARVAGSAANSMPIASSDEEALKTRPFSGGVNAVDASEAKDKKDRPRNSAIQLNFNEAVNPLTVSGSADEVANYVRVVNYNDSSLAAGATCSKNSDCKSYKCDNSVCVGNYINGYFSLSNRYRTLEFVSDEECGVNGCGEKIYCLPADSHLKVEMLAANLKACTSDADCAGLNPYKSCLDNPIGYKTCQNPDNKNYPGANISNLDGITDAAINSLDGNRSTFASGPLSFYDENSSVVFEEDNYTWSFYVNDQIKLDPPKITYITPSQGQAKVSLADPIEIGFNTLMLNSSLITGNADIKNGENIFNHKFINIRSSSPTALGYWVSNNNVDIEPFDGEPDLTITKISHSPFPESMTFYAQVGSGVKDIYQNCFKPSIGPGCPDTNGSCCFGVETDELDNEGNCIK